MDEATREQVRKRAGSCCEYCGVREAGRARLRFHIEHIIARQHGGGDGLENLALACHLCNAHKGPNLTGIDPVNGEVVPLFHRVVTIGTSISPASPVKSSARQPLVAQPSLSWT